MTPRGRVEIVVGPGKARDRGYVFSGVFFVVCLLLLFLRGTYGTFHSTNFRLGEAVFCLANVYCFRKCFVLPAMIVTSTSAIGPFATLPILMSVL